jgi:hypothetical protein
MRWELAGFILLMAVVLSSAVVRVNRVKSDDAFYRWLTDVNAEAMKHGVVIRDCGESRKAFRGGLSPAQVLDPEYDLVEFDL